MYAAVLGALAESAEKESGNKKPRKNKTLKPLRNQLAENKTENEEGPKFKLPSGKIVKARVDHIATQQCVIWPKNNRIELTRNDEDLEALIESIKQSGQAIPGLVMPSSSQGVFEVIYGSRRFAACKAAGLDFYAYILEEPISEKEALILMNLENSERKDISVYEKALSYKSWLESNIFKNTEELSAAIGVTRFTVSRIMQILELPELVRSAFNSPTEIKSDWVLELSKIAKKDEQSKENLINRAIRKPNALKKPTDVYNFLIKKEQQTAKGSPNKTSLIKNNQKQCDIIEGKDGRVKVIFDPKFSFNEVLEKLNILTEQDAVWELTDENGK